MSAIAHDEKAVVIVGSGAGGGTLAYELTKAGIPCVVLEAGPFLTNDDYVNTSGRPSARWPGSTRARPAVPGASQRTFPSFRPGS